MPQIQFGKSAYRRDAGNMPELRVVNMMAEQTPTADGGLTLMSRKGLVEYAQRGSGPIRGMFSQSGLFGGALFTVSGSEVYKDDTLIGSLAGLGPVSFAASSNVVTGAQEIVIAAGSAPVSYDGTDLAEVDMPDSLGVVSVAFMAGVYLYGIEDGRFYWSATYDGRTVGALDFATAESSADGLRELRVIGDNLFLLGVSTTETWRATGNSDLPFAIIPMRTYSKGCLATGCSAVNDNALFWVGNDGSVYRSGDTPQRLSDSGLEERIIASSEVRAFSFMYEGHALFAVVTDDDTFCFDAATGQLHNPRSYGLDRFRGSCAVNIGTACLIGDETDGRIWEFDGYSDADGPMERLFTAFFPILGGSVSVDNLWIEANVGSTGELSGQGSDPVVEMRSSRDAGRRWSDWESAQLGAQGEYRALPEWRALGMFDSPGFMAEFRVTDPVNFRVSRVVVNEPVAGRSR